MTNPVTSPPSEPKAPDHLQVQGRNLLAGLHMLVRAIKLYDAQNAIFLKPLQTLIETLGALLEAEGKVELTVVKGTFHLNGELVRLDPRSVDNLRALAAEMERRQVGGFSTSSLPEVDDLRNFLWIFSQESSGAPDEDGLPGHKLDVLRVTPWTQLVERLDKAVVDDTSDPRRHALVLYARALFLAQHDLAAHKAGKPMSRAKAVRVVQDLIEVFADHKETLLSSWCAGTGSRDAAIAAHLVNTTIIAITFGKHLGLTRAQLKELGVAALSDELGLCKLPDELHWVTAPERLEPAAQAQCQAVANQTAATFLSEPGAGRLQHLLALSTLQMHLPYMHAVKDEQGHTILQPHDDRLYFSRLLAICAYFDALLIETGEHAALSPFEALTRMWKNERWRFDPQLLGVFVRVMAREPSFSRWHPASWSMQ